MKKLFVLILLVLATLTSFSQTTVRDTTKNTSISKTKELSLTPLDITYQGVPYKAFTIPQTQDIIKELSTLEFLAWEGDVKERWITDLEELNKKYSKSLDQYKGVVEGKNKLINTQEEYIVNQEKLIKIHIRKAERTKTTLKIVTGVSIGAIGYLLFIK